jgi:hypothetical protein
MTFEEAKSAIAENRVRAPYLSYWKHLKSGGEYTVQMHVILEATLEPAIVYYKRYAAPDEVWCRLASEFFDGRFERVPNSLTV